MRHGREESGRLGFRGQLTRRHPPPLPSPLSPPPPLSPSLSDEATSPLMPPPPRDAALLRLTPPPPPSRRTPPRRTGCHLLRPVEATQFAVRHRARTEVLISENDEDDEERLTPLSLGSKRSTSSRSTACNPNKKTKNQAIWAMQQDMSKITTILESKHETMKGILAARAKDTLAYHKKIKLVQQLAREAGATESNPRLWIGVLKITALDCVMEFFINSAPKGRMAVIEYYASVGN